MKNKPVPVLITWDVDPDRWSTVENRENALSQALDLCQEFGIRSTFFITANFAHEYPAHIDRMRLLGQEIGCHGMLHTDEEDYDRMPVDLQRKYIAEATEKLVAVVGSSISSFRSPRVKTSASTLKLLSDYGYQADSSVCSQRIDFVSSNLVNPGWLSAPRKPYHPHTASAFRRGSLPIWELPVSAAIAPFISSTLKVLGLRPMKALLWLLYTESRVTGKPLVYLAHPTEFLPVHNRRARLTLADFTPSRIRTHGFQARRIFYRLCGQALYKATHELFAYLASLPGVSFMTCSEYVHYLSGSPNPDLS